MPYRASSLTQAGAEMVQLAALTRVDQILSLYNIYIYIIYLYIIYYIIYICMD